MGLTIPAKFHSMLQECPGAEEVTATFELLGAVEKILADNKMPFFPAFTDHGASHVEAVLVAAERLIPEKVWEEQLLSPADVAVFIGATLLHDIALHMREGGFVELVAEATHFKPIPWFDATHDGRCPDRPWDQAWQAFRKEAQRFSASQLTRILGPDAHTPAIVLGEDLDPAYWTEADRLFIGEFIRRNHARLAHEIAIYGFPGAPETRFPALGEKCPALAEAIGVTARSHNEDPRVIGRYLTYRARGETRPFGALVPYLIGLLRVADFFQLQPDRASPLLLHLREPQSPVSVAEWRKHQAIERISWVHSNDPRAVHVQVSPDLNVSIYLQLQELFMDLQQELDLTTAVLSETYGRSEFAALQLSRQRVDTNLKDDGLIDQLGFVPRRARPRSAEDLFRLIVSDLYGNEPVIAGRELLQNGVDAVREVRRLRALGKCPERGEFRELPADVLVEVRESETGPNLLRVVDRGVGMTADTVIDNFLTAGATFSSTIRGESVDMATAIAWMKTGKFGLGAFASFLLGSEIEVTTRHLSEDRGLSFTASREDDLVQINWVGDSGVDNVPLGTEIRVPFDGDVLPGADVRSLAERIDRLLGQTASFYALSSPTVCYRAIRADGTIHVLKQKGEVPNPAEPGGFEWRTFKAKGFDAVQWRLPLAGSDSDGFAGGPDTARLAHNGMVIRPVVDHRNMAYQWSSRWFQRNLQHPSVAVFDSRHLLGITLNRYELTERSLPFEDELMESIGKDIVARALALGPSPHPLAKRWGLRPVFGRRGWIPLTPGLVAEYVKRDLCVLWTSEFSSQEAATGFVDSESGDGALWKTLPYRLVLPLVRGGAGKDAKQEREQWGFAQDDIGRGIRELASALGRTPVASLYYRSSNGQSSCYVFKQAVGDVAPLQKRLKSLGSELINPGGSDTIALSVLRKGTDPPVSDPLARPWISGLGGMLELDRGARASRREELIKDASAYAKLVLGWERRRDF